MSTIGAVSQPTPARGAPLVRIEQLTVGFPRRAAVVGPLDLTLHAGECVALVGESGSGKSVTARSLVGLNGPHAAIDAARFDIAGIDVRRHRERDWRAIRGRRIGYVLQDALVSLDPLARARPRRRSAARYAAARHRNAQRRPAALGRHRRPRAAAAAVSAPVVGRLAAARADRHRDRGRRGAADRRRADHRARHDRATPDPVAAACAPRCRRRGAADQPRSRGRRRTGRSRARDARRPDRRARAGTRRVERADASVHAAAARGDSHCRVARVPARSHPRVPLPPKRIDTGCRCWPSTR